MPGVILLLVFLSNLNRQFCEFKYGFNMKTFHWVFVLSLLVFQSALSSELPNEIIRVKMFDRFVSEIERLDGEGLPARKNRPEDWKITTRKLREMARTAQTPVEFGQVFRLLDATYPNLHAHLVLAEKYDLAAKRLRPRIAARFAPEVVTEKQKKFLYKINHIDTELVKNLKETLRPAIGDELLEINGKPMSEWSIENFIFCKFPLRSQCEVNLFDHFRKAYLSWDWRSPLEYKLRRNERTWTVKVPVEVPTPNKDPSSQNASEQVLDCSSLLDRYEKFVISHQGKNICAFESAQIPGVVVLRIESFAYRKIPETSKIRSLKDEVNHFYDGYWKSKAPHVKKLIIDLIDNGGGDVPIEWYKIFYDKPFQEQFVQFKKTPEIESDRIRAELFYGDQGKEIWFKDLNKNGTFEKTKWGGFLPPVPQFCAYEDRNCREGLFIPRPHSFKGRVRVLVNEWCISTCTGFVWSLKSELKNRTQVIGIPDSGDSAYARLYLDLYIDSKNPDGFRIEVSERVGRTNQDLPEGALLRQQVTATRSTSSSGVVISAIPTPVDVWIPYRYRHFDESWESKVFKAGLAR